MTIVLYLYDHSGSHLSFLLNWSGALVAVVVVQGQHSGRRPENQKLIGSQRAGTQKKEGEARQRQLEFGGLEGALGRAIGPVGKF